MYLYGSFTAQSCIEPREAVFMTSFYEVVKYDEKIFYGPDINDLVQVSVHPQAFKGCFK
jgi:hypothetical protein